jgi:hypothetical protein
MRNGGPLPAHLSTSSLSNPSRWLQYKWLQPPPRALTGCLTIIKNSIPRLVLVAPFATRNGSNEHFAKTNRLPACCLYNFPGGPFFSGLVPPWNVPTRIRSGRSTNCGSTSATASRRRPANALLTSKLLTNNRRPLIANAFSKSVPPTNARRLPTRRLHIVNAL